MEKSADFESIFTEEQLNNMSPEQLKSILLLQKKQIEKQDKRIEQVEQKAKLLEEKNHELEFMNALLNDQLTLAQRKQFGASSEKYAEGFEQLGLFNETEQAADPNVAEPEMEDVLVKEHKRSKRKGKKDEDLSKFPTTEVNEHKLEGEDLYCDDCGTKRKVVNVETTKTLKFVPAHFEVIEDRVYVYSCPKCGMMVRASKPAPLLKGSIATPSLVAGIINAKYVNAMPLDRQRREFARYSLNLSTQTMANWMMRCTEKFLAPLWNQMYRIFLRGHYSHCDETRVQVLDEPEQNASTQNWMWVYQTGELSEGPQMVLFQYERTRGGYHPQEFLKDYTGYLTCDGYQPYHNLPAGITVTGCLAHSRRRFDACLTILKKDYTKGELKETTAYKAMAKIGTLYKIEKEIKELSPKERYIQRQERSKPLLDAFFEWLHTLEPDVDRSSKIGDAVLYTISQEQYLRGYLEDGHLSIDNSAAERAIRPFAVGRRNWLFSKSIRGAETSAVLYSITETAMLNGLKPFNYLSYILEVMSQNQDQLGQSIIEALLPWSPDIPDECKMQLPLPQ